MADDLTTPVPGGTKVRSKQLASGAQLQYSGAVTAIPTPVAGNQTLSVATGANTTLTVPSGATHALVCVDPGGGDIRFWEDGSNPSSTTGLLIQAGETAELASLANVKMRASTGTVTVNVAYRRYDQ